MANVIPALYAQTVIQMMGGSRDEMQLLLADMQLSPSLLEDAPQPGEMDAETFGRLFMALITRAQQDIQADSQAAEQILSLSTYRLMFTYMLQAANLEEAINRAATYFLRFHAEQKSFSLDTSGDEVVWRFHFGPPTDDEDAVTRIEHFCMGKLNWLPGISGRVSALYTWHRLCSWLTGQFIDLSAVHIDYPVLGEADSYIQSFRAPVYFNRSDCSVSFHKRYLELPIVRRETDLNRMLETFPAELMRADEMDDSAAARVKGLLGEDYSQSMPGLEEVAERLFTTAATLHRRLRSEGTSFQKIKDACRRDSAINLLRADKYSGNDIAEFLGFSDASTFYRAFKKWTGKTPQEFIDQES